MCGFECSVSDMEDRRFVIVTVCLWCMCLEGWNGRGTVGSCGWKISEGKAHLEIMHRRNDSEDVKNWLRIPFSGGSL